MSLATTLAAARTEEDVKDAYIKALGLKRYSKGLVDIQTEEIWFEAKEAATSPLLMFAQLLFYIRDAKKNGEIIPAFLAVIDREKAAIMETAHALPILDDRTIKWPKSGSAVDKTIAAHIAPVIETHFVVYKIDSHEKEFIEAIKTAITAGKIIRTPITPDNLKQVFDKWVAMIGRELEDISDTDYALLFFADVMHDGKKAAMQNLPARLLHEGDKPLFLLNGKTYELASDRGYRNFWAIYHRPPEEEYRHYLLERRDSLLPLDERQFKGAFYTPLHIVDVAYDLLAETLGRNWQEKYIVWDMCCGVGNLEVKHSNHRNIFMSTLDQADIDVMKAVRTCVEATRFQYDYLNDDISDFGEIDYSFSNKMPEPLRQAILDARENKKGAKKILVLMNPPYGEAANSQGNKGKIDIAASKIGALMNAADFGYAARELYVQFLVRIQKELPNATLAFFSTLKYVNASNFEAFRCQWKAKYLGGFILHSKAFDGLNGNFPIGFLLWDSQKKSPITEISTRVFDKQKAFIKDADGVDEVKKFYAVQTDQFLSEWLPRSKKNNIPAVPLTNAVTPVKKTLGLRNTFWSDNAIAHFFCNGNDFQNAGTMTAIFSSVHSIGHAGGYFITKENFWQAAIVFSVRRLIKPTWVNHNDQFLQPSKELTDEFKNDCLIWMLFNGSNLTAGANNLEWNAQKWSLTNHFVPFSASDMGATEKLESSFMVDYLKKLKLSKEAKAVLAEGKKLFSLYHATQFERKIRDEFKLGRPDVGWYQVRKALEVNEENKSVDFSPFKTAYAALSDKLRPQVFEFGFLK